MDVGNLADLFDGDLDLEWLEAFKDEHTEALQSKCAAPNGSLPVTGSSALPPAPNLASIEQAYQRRDSQHNQMMPPPGRSRQPAPAPVPQIDVLLQQGPNSLSSPSHNYHYPATREFSNDASVDSNCKSLRQHQAQPRQAGHPGFHHSQHTRALAQPAQPAHAPPQHAAVAAAATVHRQAATGAQEQPPSQSGRAGTNGRSSAEQQQRLALLLRMRQLMALKQRQQQDPAPAGTAPQRTQQQVTAWRRLLVEAAASRRGPDAGTPASDPPPASAPCTQPPAAQPPQQQHASLPFPLPEFPVGAVPVSTEMYAELAQATCSRGGDRGAHSVGGSGDRAAGSGAGQRDASSEPLPCASGGGWGRGDGEDRGSLRSNPSVEMQRSREVEARERRRESARRTRKRKADQMESLHQDVAALRSEVQRLQRILRSWATQGFVTPDQALEFLEAQRRRDASPGTPAGQPGTGKPQG